MQGGAWILSQDLVILGWRRRSTNSFSRFGNFKEEEKEH